MMVKDYDTCTDEELIARLRVRWNASSNAARALSAPAPGRTS